MIKSGNFVDNGNCIIKNDCPFYRKDSYSAKETLFYVEHCLRGGEGCGLKRNHDLTEKLKQRKDFPRGKRTWRS